jgi:predicted 3-demethylubiquinone-9 3-methyltransferase (glyoxalase superfamily)
LARIATCLWFDGVAEEAAAFYTSLLPDSRIDAVWRAPVDTPSGPEGAVLLVEFTLAGTAYQGLNGGPQFPFSEVVSLAVSCADQAEVDRLWHALTADGGAPSRCGWLRDRFGLSWQIVPEAMEAMMKSPDRAAARRAMEAMFAMSKLDIDTLQRAFDRAD